MKRLGTVVSLAILLLSAIGEAQTRIRLATMAPRGTSYHHTLQAMGERWRQAGVELTLYTDGTMGDEPEMVRRMRIGQIQAAMLTVTGLAEVDRSVTSLQELPMMFRDLDEVEYVREQLRPELERRMLQKGFIVLFWADTGWVHFFSRQPGIHPNDFKNMKVFVTAGDNDHVRIMQSMDFHPVPLGWTDVLPSLQTGMVDALPTAPMLALAGQYHLVTKHMLAVNWVPLVGATVITKKAWDQLPEAERAQLLQAAVEAGKEIQAQGRAEAAQAVKAMQDRGLQVHPVSPALAAEWRGMAESLYPQIRGSIVPADMFDRVHQLLAQYRATSARNKR